MMSTAPFDHDLDDMSLPLTDISWDILFVVNTRREKSSFVLVGMSLSLHFDAD